MMPSLSSQYSAVSVKTFARLHFGFLNLSDQPDRRFGSLGVSIAAFETRLKLSKGAQKTKLDPWIAGILQKQCDVLSLQEPLNLQVESTIPRHSGLGSGTQMALAIGAAVNKLLELPVSPAEIAAQHKRGARSGIGIATFAAGGMVLDGGRGPQTVIPPLLARYDFPKQWCFLLIMDQSQNGLHGSGEVNAFKKLPPQTLAKTLHVQHQLLMQGLPALVEQDFDGFSAVIGQLQAYNGEYFSPSQDGMFASQDVAAVMQTLKSAGYSGLGQTSWGPTGFVLLPDLQEAQSLKKALEEQFSDKKTLAFLITTPINHGAEVHSHTENLLKT